MMSRRTVAPLLVALAALFALVSSSRVARSQDRRAEAAAKEALQAAQADFATGAFEKAITRLRRATRGCAKCAPGTRAQLLRDTGAIEFQSGDEEGGVVAFVEALKIEPDASISQRYATGAVQGAWEAAKDEIQADATPQPSGDFVHTPAAEQEDRTPLPIYVEIDTQVSKVLVRYKRPGAKDYARLELARVGKGWGGVIPCEAVKVGVVRYYVVGLDSSGSPAATSGDPKRPFHVRIRKAISAPPPSLPGSPPPKSCTPGESAPPPATQKPEPSPEEKADAPAPEKTIAGVPRLWIGIAGSLDFASKPSGNNVCKLAPDGTPANDAGYSCTDPNGGVDFPGSKAASDALVNGKAGSPTGGVGAGDVRVLLTLDYAISTSLLLGARVGYVGNGYPGKAGKGFGPSLHFEARGTYLFGADALVRVGFAPVVVGGAGVAEYDTSQVVQVVRTGVAGEQAVLAWKTSGPGFVMVGGGVRYAFAPNIGATMLMKVTAAFGGGGIAPYGAPEVGVAYGF